MCGRTVKKKIRRAFVPEEFLDQFQTYGFSHVDKLNSRGDITHFTNFVPGSTISGKKQLLGNLTRCIPKKSIPRSLYFIIIHFRLTFLYTCLSRLSRDRL